MNYRLQQFFLFVFFIILFVALNKGGISKYILVAMIIYIMGMFLLLKKTKQKNINLRALIICLVPNIFFIISSFFIILINDDFSFINYFVKDSIFITLPIIFSFTLCNVFSKVKIDLIKLSFYALIVVFFYVHIPLYNPEDLLEGTEAFIFGVYLIYFLWRNEYKLSALSLILLLLAHKRIVTLATIVCVFLYFVGTKVNKKRKQFYSMCFIVFILFQFLFVNIIYNGTLVQLQQQFNINDMGRGNIHSLIENTYRFSISYTGHGGGFVENFLNIRDYNVGSLNLHCDILKIYIEIGFIGLLVYNVLNLIVYRNINKYFGEKISTLYFIMILFSFLNYLTDNISIYIYYLVPFYIIIFDTFIRQDVNT